MRRIQVVDDDLHVSLAIRAWLAQNGVRVTIADGGTNGLAALDTSNFDLMIVDVFMPHMRGFDSIRLFHQRVPSVPLVAISGYAFSDFEMSGADDFVSMAATLGATRRLRKTFSAGDIAQYNRRMLVESRAAPKICSHPVRGHEHSVRAAARCECKRWDEGGGIRAMSEHKGRSASGGGHAANSCR
jgi:CheY-like chemotaxis protein